MEKDKQNDKQKDELVKVKLKEELKEYNLSDEEIEDLIKLEGEIAQLMLDKGITDFQIEDYIMDSKEECGWS